MANTISMALNILFAVVIFFGIFWGLIRGFKKSISRFLFLLVCMIIALLIAAPITKALLNIQMQASLTINGETIEGTQSILSLLTAILKSVLGEEFVTTYPEFAEAVVVIPVVLVNLVVYILLFWLMKILLLPLNSLLTKLIFKPRKPSREVMGFASNNDRPEYPNSDESIQPLMDIYNQAESIPDTSPAPETQENNSYQEQLNVDFGNIEPLPNETIDNNDFNTASSDNSIGKFITKDELISNAGPNGEKPPLEIIVNQVSEPETKRQIRQRERQERRAEKLEAKSTTKKHRLLGGLVGIATSAIVLINVMMPVYGIINVLDSNRDIKLEYLTEEPTDLETLTGGITTDILTGYKSSILGKVSKTIGLEAIEMLTFDKLTSAQINNKEIVFRKDVNSIIDTLETADTFIGTIKTISDNGIEAITQEQLDNLLLKADTLITKCEEVSFVNAMSNYILPVTLHILKAQNIQFVDNPTINDMIISTLANLVEETGVDVFGEIHALIDVADYLNEQKLLIKVVKSDYSDLADTLANLDSDFSEKLSEKLFGIQTINSTLPDILKIGFSIFEDATHFGYSENEFTDAEIKESMQTLLANIIDVALTISDESSIYLTDNSLVSLGELLNTIRNSHLMNTETYDNLLNYTITQIKRNTTEIIPENFQDYFNNNLLRNITEITDWKAEMQTIADTLKVLRHKDYGILGEVKDNAELRQGYTTNFTLSQGVLKNIGKALDTLESSVLFKTNTTIDINDEYYTTTSLIKLVSALFTEIKNIIPTDNSLTAEMVTLFDEINENLITAEHQYKTNSTFWEDEFAIVSPLIIEIYSIADSGEFQLTPALATALDTAAHGTETHKAVLLGDDTTLQLMSKVLNVVEDSILGEDFKPSTDNTLNDNIHALIDDTKTKLVSEDTKLALANDKKFWETELNIFLSLMNLADKAGSITTIQSATEIATDLDKIYTSRIIPSKSLNNIIANVLGQIKSSDNSGIAGSINEIIDGVASDIVKNTFWDNVSDTSNFWEIELTHINNLLSLKLSDDGEYKVLNNLSTIGVRLDNVISGTPDLRASYLITENRVNKLLSTALDAIKSNETTGITGKINNLISNISSDLVSNSFWSTVLDKDKFWQIELTHIQNLGNLKLADEGSDYKILEHLNDLGISLDNITLGTSILRSSYLITQNRLQDILSTAVSEMTTAITDKFAIESMKDTVVTAVEKITNNIANTNIASFKTELGHLSNLATLNISANLFTFHEDFTSQRLALEDLGDKLDKIAYNLTEGGTSDSGEKITIFDETKNSKIITRDIIVDIIKSAFDSIKLKPQDDTTPLTKAENAFNALIDGVGTKGEEGYITGIKDTISDTIASGADSKDLVLSWKRELSYVCILTQLGNNKTFTLNTAAEEIGKNIDALAFNVSDNKFADVKRHEPTGGIEGDYSSYTQEENTITFVKNSLLIKRTMLKNLINTLSSELNTNQTHTDITADSIKDELIASFQTKININIFNENTNYYNNYFDALTDLDNVYNQITSLANSITNTGNYQDINFTSIDTTLDTLQDLKISGTIITRHLAMLLVSKAQTKLESDIPAFDSVAKNTYDYLTQLAEDYSNNNTNAPNNAEDYCVEKHFETIKDKLSEDGQILVS